MCNKKERKRDRRWYLFPVSTLGSVYFAVHGGTGRFFFFSEAGRGGCCCFSEAGRGGCFFFPRWDGVAFFFPTGRDGAVFFFFFRGPGRDGCFWRWQFFWRDGAKSLHRPAKGGLNRPASRPCKALVFHIATPEGTHHAAFLNILSAARELLLVATLLPAKARQLSTRRQASSLDLEEDDGRTSGHPSLPR